MNINLLDHGYVRLVEHYGSGDSGEGEAGIIEAARMSTNKGFNGWERDEKLLAFLYENKHYTPFEMAGMIVEIGAPIMVFREWHRHRTQSYNEMSGRYIALPDVNYVPSIQRLMINAGKTVQNKQAASASTVELTEGAAINWLAMLEHAYSVGQSVYEQGLAIGVPKELARLPVSVARYSRMRCHANLRNWLAFLTLRMDEKAQWEIRQYAHAVAVIIGSIFPRTYKLFCQGR